MNEPQVLTPHPTSSHEKVPLVAEGRTLAHRPASSDHVMRRSSSAEGHKSHRRGMFGGGGGSEPVSRESSPSRGSASNFYSKPMTPGGDANDPYAKADGLLLRSITVDTQSIPGSSFPERRNMGPLAAQKPTCRKSAARACSGLRTAVKSISVTGDTEPRQQAPWST